MARFTLRQLLVGVLLGCVYLAVLRDVFIEAPHAAVSIAAWVILAILYFRLHLWATLMAHSLFPSAVILVFLFAVLMSGLRYPQEFGDSLPVLCRGSSLIVFPFAIIRVLSRHSKERAVL